MIDDIIKNVGDLLKVLLLGCPVYYIEELLHFLVISYFRETLNPLQPWRAFNITVSSNSTEIRNLRKWTFYDLRIYGATLVGQGLISANVTVQTDEDGEI